MVQDVRFHSSREATRVVIEIDGEAPYRTGRLSRPDRLYIDLPQTRMPSDWERQTVQLDDGRLQAIRIAQNQPHQVRVVLDLQTRENPHIFTLPEPYRIVIDLPNTQAAPPADPPRRQPPSPSLEAAIPQADPLRPRPSSPPPEAAAPPANASRPRPSSPPPELESLRAPPKSSLIIVIDPGHGGKDPGAIGPGGLMEKEVVLHVAKALRELIHTAFPQARVFLTRERDVFILLEQRARFANAKNADLFVSLHVNSSKNREARGIETWYLSFAANERAKQIAARENRMAEAQLSELEIILRDLQQTDRINQSAILAGITQKALIAQMQEHYKGIPDRGIDGAPFLVLLHTSMPSILVEMSFVSHPREERQLRNPAYQRTLAHGILQGMRQFLSSAVTAQR